MDIFTISKKNFEINYDQKILKIKMLFYILLGERKYKFMIISAPPPRKTKQKKQSQSC